jgi:hypothetical protein
MRKIHIIFRYTFTNGFTQFDYDVVGAFTSIRRAREAFSELPPETENKIYDVLSIPMNKVLGKDSGVSEIFSDGTDSMIVEGLVKKGLVEPLIGEDGEFYFILTEEGKKLAEKRKKKEGGE